MSEKEKNERVVHNSDGTVTIYEYDELGRLIKYSKFTPEEE